MDMQNLAQTSLQDIETGSLLSYLNADEREAYEERAAIMQYDAGLSRIEAEFRALRIILSEKMREAV